MKTFHRTGNNRWYSAEPSSVEKEIGVQHTSGKKNSNKPKVINSCSQVLIKTVPEQYSHRGRLVSSIKVKKLQMLRNFLTAWANTSLPRLDITISHNCAKMCSNSAIYLLFYSTKLRSQELVHLQLDLVWKCIDRKQLAIIKCTKLLWTLLCSLLLLTCWSYIVKI